MKRLVLAVLVALSLLIAVITGCAGPEVETPAAGTGVASTCVACHTDKDTLKEVASPETGEAHSEATSGEG